MKSQTRLWIVLIGAIFAGIITGILFQNDTITLMSTVITGLTLDYVLPSSNLL